MNPFAAAAMGIPWQKTQRGAQAPCIVDDLPNLIGPVSQFEPAKRARAEEMIAAGYWDCVKRGDEFYVSSNDSDPAPQTADEADEYDASDYE